MRYRTTVTNKEDNSVGYLDYVWVDSKLISISFTSDELNQTVKYLYNDFDEPVGFVSTREDGSVDTYYYLKNAQGDITNIVSAAGKKMVTFTYDVFGKRTVEYQANNSTTPGQIELLTQMKADLLNPFAYRGYCYDYDMGMYYLQSRYYDPNTGRFINADDTNYLNATGTVLGCNLFAYCENDPVNRVDPRGTISLNQIFGVSSIVSSVLSALGTVALLAFRQTPWGKFLSLFISLTSIASNVYSYIVALNSAKNYYGKNSKNYNNLIKYNSAILIGNIAAIIIGDVLGARYIINYSSNIALALIQLRTITIIGLTFSAAEILTNQSLLYRNRVRK